MKSKPNISSVFQFEKFSCFYTQLRRVFYQINTSFSLDLHTCSTLEHVVDSEKSYDNATDLVGTRYPLKSTSNTYTGHNKYILLWKFQFFLSKLHTCKALNYYITSDL